MEDAEVIAGEPGAPAPDDADYMVISRRVPVEKGKWKIVPAMLRKRLMSILDRLRLKAKPAPLREEQQPGHSPAKRILVVGSERHSREVTSYSWDRFPAGFNVADFDVVILNFAAFDEDPDLAAGFPVERLPDNESLGRLFFAENTELIAIGDPNTEIGPEPEVRGFPLGGRTRASDCLPFWFRVQDEAGSSFQVKDPEWQFYFSKLSAYQWFLVGEMGSRFQDPTHYMRNIGLPHAHDLRALVTAIAETRFERPIGVSIDLAAVRYKDPVGLAIDYGRQEFEMVRTSSPIYWLPALDGMGAAEAVDVVLAERFLVSNEARRPEWVEGYSLPVEEKIATEIAGLEQQREELGARIADARLRAESAAAPRALLYGKGKSELEPVVRDALRDLEAEVRDPDREGIEDGILLRPEGSAVIEIKGRKNDINLSDVRQVVHWASEAKIRDGIEYKPIIVGNPHCESPLDERGEPLAPNALSAARNGGVAFLSTVQVHEALRSRQLGEFDAETFWQRVLGAKGPVEL